MYKLLFLQVGAYIPKFSLEPDTLIKMGPDSMKDKLVLPISS